MGLQVPADETTPPKDTLESYMERLVKLVPAEVMTIYLLGTGIIGPDIAWGLAAWAAVCLGLVIFTRARLTRDKAAGEHPQWAAVAISAVSFVLWIYNLAGGPFQALGLDVRGLGQLAVLVWTYLVPFFYKGD
jgi:hypothetical protein